MWHDGSAPAWTGCPCLSCARQLLLAHRRTLAGRSAQAAVKRHPPGFVLPRTCPISNISTKKAFCVYPRRLHTKCSTISYKRRQGLTVQLVYDAATHAGILPFCMSPIWFVRAVYTSCEKGSQVSQPEHTMNTQHLHASYAQVHICRPYPGRHVRQRDSARLWACPMQTGAQLRPVCCTSAALRPQPAVPAAAPRTQRRSRAAALRTDAPASLSGTRSADLTLPAAGAAPCTAALAQLQQHEGQQPVAAPTGEGRWRDGRLVLLLSAALATGGGARAEEVVPQSADWVVSIVFTLALVALALVTLGVCSLSVFSCCLPTLWPHTCAISRRKQMLSGLAARCVGCLVHLSSS